MASVSSLLIRRHTDTIDIRLEYRDQSQVIGLIGTLVIVSTAVAFGFAIFWVDYTCNHVIGTLAAVEDSHPENYVRLEGENSNDSYDPTNADFTALVATKPITSGLHSGIKHLHARGGIWSCFRGFRMFLAFTSGGTVVSFLVPATIRIPIHYSIRLFLGQFVARMLFTTWQMAWVHLVIADKSPRRSYRRMLGLRHWSRIAPAAALYNVLMCASFSLPLAARGFASWTVTSIFVTRGFKELLNALISILPGIFFLLVSTPARAIYIRVAASMLPEEDDPIVPFDRLFGGKTNLNMAGGGDKLGLKDAWVTFERSARSRYFRTILKALAIEVALGVVGTILVMGEVFFVTSIR